MTHTEFTEFFRNIARRHVDIQHMEDKQHFARIVLTRDPFLDSRAQISELLEKSSFTLQTPLMLISSYTSEYMDNQGDFIGKLLTARMIILKEVKTSDFDTEEAVLTETERIGEECLAYAAHYFEENEDKGMLLWSNTGNEKLTGITDRNFGGTGFTLGILINDNPHVGFNPDKFIE